MKNFDPTRQYRSTIIRGKAKRDLDDLLPRYANIIQEICPCPKSEFSRLFNEKLRLALGGAKKTLDNHRTEIAGKLFGMFFVDKEDIVYPSERALRFIENQDQPEFFKDICAKFQFPSGMDSVNTIKDKIDNKISIRQFSFILELLSIAEDNKTNLYKNEIAYFVLNSLDVLQGKAAPAIVYETMIAYRLKGGEVKVEEEGKASSYSMQHINEQLRLLELANLIRTQDDLIVINPLERKSIDYIRSFWNKKIEFDVYNYDFGNPTERKKMLFDWQLYFSQVDKRGLDVFATTIEALQYNIEKPAPIMAKPVSGKIQLGDDGENFVYNYEIDRVKKYDKRLINKILLLGKTKGLGYDIQSIIADGSEKSEFVQYIEVKSTKRVTVPEESLDGWLDSVTLTRNEWIAAEQHEKSFLIYRVYFTPDKVIVYVIKNPYQKNSDGSLKCIPLSYRMDFSSKSIDYKFEKV